MLASLARLKPLIEPFAPHKAAPAEHQVRQLRNSGDPAAEDVMDVSLGDSKNLGDFLDGQDA